MYFLEHAPQKVGGGFSESAHKTAKIISKSEEKYDIGRSYDTCKPCVGLIMLEGGLCGGESFRLCCSTFTSFKNQHTLVCFNGVYYFRGRTESAYSQPL